MTARHPALRASALLAALVALACLHGAAAACTHPLRQQGFSLCGTPGQGTHSYSAPPNNWQSDNAVDFCATPGTKVYAVEDGVVCRGCGEARGAGSGSSGVFAERQCSCAEAPPSATAASPRRTLPSALPRPQATAGTPPGATASP